MDTAITDATLLETLDESSFCPRLICVFDGRAQKGSLLMEVFRYSPGDSETASAARGLEQEIRSWKFLLTVIIWYNILHEVNRVSKLLQSPQVGIDVLQYEVGYVFKFLKEYRENGLSSALTDARDIAEEMEMPVVFPTTQGRKTQTPVSVQAPKSGSFLDSDTRGKVQ
ncbi:unnamed protein product [Leuciscus chuanchicus]